MNGRVDRAARTPRLASRDPDPVPPSREPSESEACETRARAEAAEETRGRVSVDGLTDMETEGEDRREEDFNAIVEAEDDAVDRSVHPSGIVPVLQYVESEAKNARETRRVRAAGERSGENWKGNVFHFK